MYSVLLYAMQLWPYTISNPGRARCCHDSYETAAWRIHFSSSFLAAVSAFFGECSFEDALAALPLLASSVSRFLGLSEP